MIKVEDTSCPVCLTGKVQFEVDTISNFKVLKVNDKYKAKFVESNLLEKDRILTCNNTDCLANSNDHKEFNKILENISILE